MAPRFCVLIFLHHVEQQANIRKHACHVVVKEMIITSINMSFDNANLRLCYGAVFLQNNIESVHGIWCKCIVFRQCVWDILKTNQCVRHSSVSRTCTVVYHPVYY